MKPTCTVYVMDRSKPVEIKFMVHQYPSDMGGAVFDHLSLSLSACCYSWEAPSGRLLITFHIRKAQCGHVYVDAESNDIASNTCLWCALRMVGQLLPINHTCSFSLAMPDSSRVPQPGWLWGYKLDDVYDHPKACSLMRCQASMLRVCACINVCYWSGGCRVTPVNV